MTLRTLLYLLVVGVALTMTAFMHSPESVGHRSTQTLDLAMRQTYPPSEDRTRWGLLLTGIGAVLVTYRQAYLNFRR